MAYFNDTTLQQAKPFNQRSKFTNMFNLHLKNQQCFGTLLTSRCWPWVFSSWPASRDLRVQRAPVSGAWGCRSGPWFNIKMSSYQYGKSHCGDKTILRPSYLHNGISYTGKMTSLYWIRAQSPISKPEVSATVCLFGGDSSHTPVLWLRK